MFRASQYQSHFPFKTPGYLTHQLLGLEEPQSLQRVVLARQKLLNIFLPLAKVGSDPGRGLVPVLLGKDMRLQAGRAMAPFELGLVLLLPA